MKNIWLGMICIFISSCASHPRGNITGERKPTSEMPPFNRALIIEGKNLNAAISVGIYDAFADSDKRPDVVISTCGASIANGILNTIPNRRDRMKYLLSEEFYLLLKSVMQRDPHLFPALGNFAKRLAGMSIRRRDLSAGADATIPPLFDGYLLNVGQISSGAMHEKYFSPTDPIRSVVIGAKLYFGPKNVGEFRNGRKLYQETYFTDTETAKNLVGFVSPIAQSYPDSAIDSQTATSTDFRISDAVRISVSDPYLMAPVQMGHDYYLAGTIDLYPLEVANKLAKEVVAVYPTDFDFIEQSAIGSSFQVDDNDRLRHYTASYARYWVDYSDFSEIDDDQFGPIKIDLFANKLSTNFPNNLSEFRSKIKSQWAVGYARGNEALHQAANSKAHIRGINGNTSKETKQQMAKQNYNKNFETKLPSWAIVLFNSPEYQ